MIDREDLLDESLRKEMSGVVSLQTHNWDALVLVCGLEGSGKSTLAAQMCKYVDPNFSLKNVAFSPTTFQDLARDRTNAAILWDECQEGTDSKRWYDPESFMTTTFMQRIRKNRLFIVMVKPVFFEHGRYLSMHRSVALLESYSKDPTTRGYYAFWGRHDKRQLFVKGKKFEDMRAHPPSYRGYARELWFFDEDGGWKAYDKLKDEDTERFIRERRKGSRGGKREELWFNRTIILINHFVKQGVTKAEIAKILDISPQALRGFEERHKALYKGMKQ